MILQLEQIALNYARTPEGEKAKEMLKYLESDLTVEITDEEGQKQPLDNPTTSNDNVPRKSPTDNTVQDNGRVPSADRPGMNAVPARTNERLRPKRPDESNILLK